MFKHLPTLLAAASLLCVGCSQLKSFSGASDDQALASASWNQSSESESSWSEDMGDRPASSNPETDGVPTAAAFQIESGTGRGGEGAEMSDAEETSASAYDFNGMNDADPAAELFNRVELLQTTTATLSADVKQLSKQFSTLVASCNASATQAQASADFVETAASQIDSFGETLASLDSLVSKVSTEVSATRTEMRDVRTELRNVGTATTASLTPVIEASSGSTGTWFKITLAAVVAGFVGLSYFCWKAMNSSRNGSAASR